MPIEIKELHINVTVNAESQPPATGKQAGGKTGGDSGDKDTLITECVEQVLQILQNKQER